MRAGPRPDAIPGRRSDPMAPGLAPWLGRAVEQALGSVGLAGLPQDDTLMILVSMAILVSFALAALRHACCRRRANALDEAQALKLLRRVVPVYVHRQQGEKLGLGIDGGSHGSLKVNAVYPGGAVDRHNEAEAVRPGCQVLAGDNLIFVQPAGQAAARDSAEMMNAIAVGGDLTLGVTSACAEPSLRLVVSTVVLEGLSLATAVGLREPWLTWLPGGPAAGVATEVASVSPTLAAWVAQRRAEGACWTQHVAEGDRVVSVNGVTEVAAPFLHAENPMVFLARWVPAAALWADAFEVTIERASPEERLGLEIREQPGSSQAEVLRVVQGGAMARWNSTPGRRPVQSGDRIVEVNGQAIYNNMYQEFGKRTICLRMERWAGGAASGDELEGPAPSALPPAFGAAAAPLYKPQPQPPPSTPPAPAGAASGGGPPAGGPLADGNGGYWKGSAFAAAALAFFVLSFLDETAAASMIKVVWRQTTGGQDVRKDRCAQRAGVLLPLGCLLSLSFVAYEVWMLGRPAERRTLPQIFVALAAAVCLGQGNLYVLLWAGTAA